MSGSRVLVLGTHNRKKGEELQQLLVPYQIHLKTLADYPEALQVEETGSSFAENAELKASVQARHLGQWVLGEDSGLMVDALGGAPGIYSARYSGPQATDEANNRHLLAALGDLPLQQRTARYVCHIAVADPQGQIRARAEDVCCGRIRLHPAGDSGFGYDPLFEIVEYHRTFAELGLAVKSVLSHRARAIRAILPQLQALTHSPDWVPPE